MLGRRAFKTGVRVFSINPAYKSVLGRNNYMSRYGILRHEVEAHVIAREVQKYSMFHVKQNRLTYKVAAIIISKTVLTELSRLC